jgi:hypothetical protein
MSRFLKLVPFVAAVAVAGMLTACAGQNAAQVTQLAATDAQTLAAGLQAELPAIESVPGVSASTVSLVKVALSDLQTEAAALSTSLTTTEAQPVVQKIEADVNAVVQAASGLPGIPPAVTSVLQAADVVLPIIEESVGLITNVVGSPAMGPAQALVILHAAAGK